MTLRIDRPGEVPPHGVGDVLEIRDFRAFLPPAGEGERRWHLAPYRLIDGTAGYMIDVNEVLSGDALDIERFEGGVPPTITIRLPLVGRYAIYMGMPVLDHRPRTSGPNGVDIAIGDGDDAAFANVGPEFGVRRGVLLAERNREYLCFFRSVALDGLTMRVRVPFGTFSSNPLGLVRATLSVLRFVRLADDADLTREPGVLYEETRLAALPERACPSPDENRPVVVVVDGFSHYHMFGQADESIDERLPPIYKDTDVRMLMLQISGPTLWRSDVTSFFGEGLAPDDMRGKRTGDVRLCRYLGAQIERGHDPVAAMAKSCHANGLAFHFSVRANLFFSGQGFTSGEERFMNGRWWMSHPEARLPGSKKLDYARADVRAYFLDLVREVLSRYDVDGINWDLTRWPPILSPERHDPDVLISFARELRAVLDEATRRTGKAYALSMSLVEDHHAFCTLEAQAIDLPGLLAARVLDFVCLQSWHIARWKALAAAHDTPLYAIQDGTTIHHQGRHFSADPLWRLEDGAIQDDPRAGEEWNADPPLNSCLSPDEYALAFAHYYDEGADGLCVVNRFFGDLTLRDAGHVAANRVRARRRAAYGQCAGAHLFVEGAAVPVGGAEYT